MSKDMTSGLTQATRTTPAYLMYVYADPERPTAMRDPNDLHSLFELKAPPSFFVCSTTMSLWQRQRN